MSLIYTLRFVVVQGIVHEKIIINPALESSRLN
jgi:hypothetical protein